MKLAEALGAAIPETLPRIEGQRLELLWHDDYWDGPMSGLMRLDGDARVWFTLAEENEAPAEGRWYRRYWLVRLSAEQLDAVERRHALFREHIGGHTDYDELGDRDLRLRCAVPDWEAFRAATASIPELDQRQCEVFGWLEW